MLEQTCFLCLFFNRCFQIINALFLYLCNFLTIYFSYFFLYYLFFILDLSNALPSFLKSTSSPSDFCSLFDTDVSSSSGLTLLFAHWWYLLQAYVLSDYWTNAKVLISSSYRSICPGGCWLVDHLFLSDHKLCTSKLSTWIPYWFLTAYDCLAASSLYSSDLLHEGSWDLS